ncbi:WecB/TagA/CpsF family glycosyltransferase [Pseudorhodobacter aquimaris]|uniref:WecB/TagA/CpsF family glycosyltransferase n=1 Tax=Pseudorhodobacter aquimaris TaxID=687412 RepID=UPI00067C0F7D|nr:WecB/TagA/CpsF family glycosyltransferase [Pseudorhodobacter aquimaris]
MQFSFDTTNIVVTHKNAATTIEEVESRLIDGRGFALATINLDHLTKLRSNPEFLKAYAKQDIVVTDGNPLVWLSHLAHKPVSLVPGADLVIPLVETAARTNKPVVLLGSTDAALAGAARHLTKLVPNVKFARSIAPVHGFDPTGDSARAILEEVRQVGPCLCLVALGAPKQEILSALGRDLAPQAGFACIGAGVDFLAGDQIRAPKWVRKMALEWAWRMMQNPKRLVPRYAACAAILPGQFIQAIKQR